MNRTEAYPDDCGYDKSYKKKLEKQNYMETTLRFLGQSAS